jgi:putative protease
MAAKKKAKGKVKGKSKTRRKAKAARKPAARKKAARKQVSRKKAPVRRAPAKAKRAPARKPAPAKPLPAAPAVAAPPGQRIGIVTHYFTELSVAVVKLESGTLRVGDTIHFRGHTTDFAQRVDSLQVNHAPVVEVGSNDDFGIKVRDHAREHDVVYKVK